MKRTLPCIICKILTPHEVYSNAGGNWQKCHTCGFTRGYPASVSAHRDAPVKRRRDWATILTAAGVIALIVMVLLSQCHIPAPPADPAMGKKLYQEAHRRAWVLDKRGEPQQGWGREAQHVVGK